MNPTYTTKPRLLQHQHISLFVFPAEVAHSYSGGIF